METLRAPRWDRPAAERKPRAETAHPRTPIYNALVREWWDAGRTVPAAPQASAESGAEDRHGAG
ncbi:hypothetical protein AB0910_19080 [Streptomyces sp. NPDC047002]|uniref:hypothetical protein n=1 Tax=Streptomyces sp. NPDC047002 TaxID=3155475 RepID=UPI0034565EAC